MAWKNADAVKTDYNITVTNAQLQTARQECLRVKGLALTTDTPPSSAFEEGVAMQALANRQSTQASVTDEMGSQSEGVRLYPFCRAIMAKLIIPSPAGVVVEPVTLTWPDGSTVALSRTDDVVTARATPANSNALPAGTQPLPAEFTPAGFAYQLSFASLPAASAGRYLLNLIEAGAGATVQFLPTGDAAPFAPFTAQWLVDPLAGADGPTRDNGFVRSLVG